jgi:Ca-activated chloride channel family protein
VSQRIESLAASLRALFTVFVLTAALGLAACDRQRPEFTIISGSENKSLEPIVEAFCQKQRVTCHVNYKGSLDIGLAIAENRIDFDAVWPANSIWIDLFDKRKVVRDLTPIMRSPVILGVRRSKAEDLGWVGRDVTTADIVEAVKAKRLTFLMTSATQSNSGAGAYVAMLSAALGHPDAISVEDLEKPGVRDMVRTLLSGVRRTAGSSGWLADLYLKGIEQGVRYDAIWNYEAVIAETNQKLAERKAELLYAVYPSDGVAFANSPLGFVDRGNHGEERRKFFQELQAHLLSPEVQSQLVAQFRRPAVGEATTGTAQPDWNYDPRRLVTLIRMPQADVVRAALNLYQEVLRRPSLTAYCLDFSGSMKGKGENALKEAMAFVLRPAEASTMLVQYGREDRILILPFDSDVRAVIEGTGSEADQARLLAVIQNERANDGTDIYTCAERAMDVMASVPDRERYLAAIALMTDGKSEVKNREAFLQRWRASGGELPVFGITFGDADRSQLEQLAETTRARVFDGTKNLREAFRTLRGYN